MRSATAGSPQVHSITYGFPFSFLKLEIYVFGFGRRSNVFITAGSVLYTVLLLGTPSIALHRVQPPFMFPCGLQRASCRRSFVSDVVIG